MKARSVAAVGLLVLSGVAAAAPVNKGVNGPLGDELFYNYFEIYTGQTYAEINGNERESSKTTAGGGLSMFIADPIYLLANYRYTDFEFFDSLSGTDNRLRQKRTSVGLGGRLPVSYGADLFANATYELQDKKRTPPLLVTATTSEPAEIDYEGAGFEGGIRGFVSGFAELSLSYRYREVRSEDVVAAGRREILKEKTTTVGLTIPVASQLSLFARAEYGVNSSNLITTTSNHPDVETEAFILGLRGNFYLPR